MRTRFQARTIRSSVRRLALLSVSAVALTSFSSAPCTSHATDGLSVGLDALGQQQTVELTGAPATSTLTLAVPAGLRPLVLTGTVEVAADGSSGILEVVDATRRLLSVDLAGQPGRAVPLRVPLSEAAVTDRAVTLTFNLSSTEDRCGVSSDRPTTLRDLTLVYRGSETEPSTVANFLPPVLRRLDLYVPDGASREVKAATVTLADAVAARYNPAAPVIKVHSLTDVAAVNPTAPLTRAVVLPGSGPAGLALTAHPRVLSVNGSGPAVAAQVDALNGNLGAIAQTSRAVANHAQARPQLPPSTQTLPELGLGQVRATGLGTAKASLGVDSAALGLPASSWAAHLLGTVTTGAEPSTSASRGTLTLTANGSDVASWPIPEDGRFDLRPTIPGSALGRYTALSLVATANGSGGCAALPKVDLTVDARSTFRAVREPPPPFGGFDDLPAALRPSYQIATTGQTIADLDDAVALAVSLQRQVEVTLDPQLVEVDTLLSSTMPAVLVAGTTVPAGVTLPLAATNARVRLNDGSTLEGDPALATFQVSDAGGRYLGVVSGTRPELVRGLIAWLSDPRQLATLRGDVAVYDATGGVRTLALNVKRPVGAQDRADSGSPFGSFRRVVEIGLVAVLTLAAGLALGYTVARQRSGAKDVPTSEEDDSGWAWEVPRDGPER